jgi:hypothetical protein
MKTRNSHAVGRATRAVLYTCAIISLVCTGIAIVQAVIA